MKSGEIICGYNEYFIETWWHEQLMTGTYNNWAQRLFIFATRIIRSFPLSRKPFLPRISICAKYEAWNILCYAEHMSKNQFFGWESKEGKEIPTTRITVTYLFRSCESFTIGNGCYWRYHITNQHLQTRFLEITVKIRPASEASTRFIIF